MKSRTAVAALSMLSIGGCADFFGGADAAKPQVLINAGSPNPITVNPPVLEFRDRKEVEIVWRLKIEQGGGYRFDPKDGIVIEGEITNRVVRSPAGAASANGRGPDSVVLDRLQDQIVGCAVREGGLEFTCRNKHTRFGIYKYSIRLTGGGAPLVFDPVAVNW